MKKMILSAAILALPIAAFAAAPVKPGEWKITTQSEMVGAPMQMPPVTTTICITKEDAEKAESTVPKGRGDCKVLDFKVEGNKATWKMDCTTKRGGKMTGVGEATYSGDSYSGKYDMKMSGGPQGDMEIKSTFQGTRISDSCTK